MQFRLFNHLESCWPTCYYLPVIIVYLVYLLLLFIYLLLLFIYLLFFVYLPAIIVYLPVIIDYLPVIIVYLVYTCNYFSPSQWTLLRYVTQFNANIYTVNSRERRCTSNIVLWYKDAIVNAYDCFF